MSDPLLSNPSGAGPLDDDLEIAALEQRLHAPRLPTRTPRAIGVVGVLAAVLPWLGLDAGPPLSMVVGWMVFAVSLVVVSRVVEGARKAKDRLATTLVSSAFVVALLPLVGLLWQVVSKGAPQISSM